MTTALIVSITVICVVAIICYTILKTTTVTSRPELDKIYERVQMIKIDRIEWEMTSVKESIQRLADQIEKTTCIKRKVG